MKWPQLWPSQASTHMDKSYDLGIPHESEKNDIYHDEI
jgi:hypothetical protein